MQSDDQLLVPMNSYLKAGIHIGTKFKTTYMDNFIYKARPDGLFVLNLQKIDERLVMAAKFISKYEPQDIMVVCRRENGWKPVKLFGKLTGTKVFPGRYPPGIITNPALDSFMEIKLLIVADAWPDRNAVLDAIKMGVPVVGLCDTNNQANDLDVIIPCNNKGKKSLGLIFWVLAREYFKNRGLGEFTATAEDFTEE